MLLSVYNFKSIEEVVDVDVSNLTVLAGVNSSGKSSLIQALLLLKQTLTTSMSEMLNIDGPYVYADSLLDLVHNKRNGDMKFVLKLSKEEFSQVDAEELPIEGDLNNIEISATFRVRPDTCVLSEFTYIQFFKTASPSGFNLIYRPRKKVFDLRYNDEYIKDLHLDDYSFANFFPIFASKDGVTYNFQDIKAARSYLVNYLEKVVYIAPLRVAPVLARTYQTDVEKGYILPDGENTRFILDEISNDLAKIGLVKRWLCDEFHLAKDINVVKESGKRYRVVVTTNEDLKVDLVHMGFGLSQILPIITQGCISPRNSLMIVEDPEVHMHPSIQASMADFFIFLCNERKVAVMTETHSDHFITRLRRRIAEKVVDFDKVHLIFVISESGESIYKTIPLSDTGRMTGSMPPGFMDTRDQDFKAILEANRK